MPYRRLLFINNHYYHVFNRSVGAEKIFTNKIICSRALEIINYYRYPTDISYSHLQLLPSHLREMRLKNIYSRSPMVEIVAFSLMPNHFHFVIKQLADGGIKKIFTNFQNSFARYYNIKLERYGAVFSQQFKAVFIETERQLFHVIRYVDLNPVTSGLININQLDYYLYSSFSSYQNRIKNPFIVKDLVIDHFNTAAKYQQFVYNHSGYQKSLKKIKGLLLD